MVGEIAVGIIIVSGPTPDLQFSFDETKKVIAEVQNGLTWLAEQNPAARITWNYDINHVQIDVPPGGGGNQEALWRDPAMEQLGFSGNWQGVIDYVEDIRKQLKTDWTYVGYFTKYPLKHFAYAKLGGPSLVMQYDNDGWGPDNIDRVFAHETGHIFQAPDEYAKSNCNCVSEYGIYDEPNKNCALCAPGGSVDCIMRKNTWSMCQHTPLHLGFPQPTAIKYGETVGVFSSTRPFRLDIGTWAMKKNVPASHESWATKLRIKRLDGESSGPVRTEHVVGIFSEDGRKRLDIGTASMKKDISASHESWATMLKILPVGGSKKAGDAIDYGDLVGVFSSTRPFRLDIGSDALNPQDASHNSWATRLKIDPQ